MKAKHKSSDRVFRSIICLLLVLCAALSFMLLSNYRDSKRGEALYMNRVYANLQDILLFIDELTDAQTTPEGQVESMIALRYALLRVGDQLEDGPGFVAECIPGVAAWWFDETAAEIRDGEQPLLSEQGGISAYGVAFLGQLSEDIHVLVDQLVGEDQMNLNPEISIEEFSKIISEFYSSR